jgi:DNA-binding CsgD family transcriptional regulator
LVGFMAGTKAMLAAGKSQAECASELGVSIRTIGRAVARMRAGL